MALKEINMIGVTINAVREFEKNGFSIESLTKVVLNGMNVGGVDQKTIDLVVKLSERAKDARALLSGDINEILNRADLAGLPVGALRQIAQHGFTVDTITQLTLEGMAKMGVDQNTIDLIKQVPERIKDAQALLSGDLDKMFDRAAAAGLSVDAIRQIVKDGFNFQTVTKLALDGMSKAGVDQKTIDLVKQIPDRIEDAKAICSGDINRIIDRGILAGLPLETVQKIAKEGFTAENITKLAQEGMQAAGANKKTLDLLNQLPERIKDAQAILSGDVNRILERGLAAGLPVKTIHQIVQNGFTPENAIELAVEGMTAAGVDSKKIDLVKLLPERIKDAQALLSGDFDRILERGLSAGLPLNTIRHIIKHGVDIDSVSQLAIEGMTIAGVDPNKIKLVQQLPEQVKDLQALASGDLDRIAKRGLLAGIPVDALRQVINNEVTVETISNIALAGMDIAGVDKHTIDFVKELPQTIKAVEAVLKGDLEQLLKPGVSTSIDHVVNLFHENSLFNGKEKELFNLLRHQMRDIRDMIDESKTGLEDILKTIDDHISKLPIDKVLPIVLNDAVQRAFDSEKKNLQDLCDRTINQISSTIPEGLTQQTCDIINEILKSTDKWAKFQASKHQLDARIQQLLGLFVEREREFHHDVDKINNNQQIVKDLCKALSDLRITFASIEKRRVDLQNIIDRFKDHGGSILKRAIENFVDEITQKPTGTRNSMIIGLLKDYVEEIVINPKTQRDCERKMDKNDTKLGKQFAKAITHIRKQHH